MISRPMVTAEEATRERAATGISGVDPLLRVAGAELDRAYRLAGLFLGNSADAEDAVGLALERAWTRRGQLRDVAAYQAWFDRILVNICRDLIRRRGKVRFIGIEEPVQLPSADAFGAFLERDAVLRAVRRLGSDERLVVLLHFWADLSLEAVADRCNWPLGTVKSRLHRALEALRADPELEGGPP